MKIILLFTCVLTLLTSGCLVSEGGRHGHSHGPSAVIVGPPVVVVPAPVIVVPVVRVHHD